MSDRLAVRAATEDEFGALLDTAAIAFHGGRSAAARQRLRDRFELDRSRIALDGGGVVGTSAAWGWRLTVPGGELPCAAITLVTVLPTHRRRGILRRMMEALVADARERGEPLAALWASEGRIYGRFGFGPASWTRRSRIDLAGGVSLRSPVADPPLRLVDLAGAAPLTTAIFDRARRQRAGIMSRPPAWWTTRILSDAEDERPAGGAPKRLVACGEDGYALYRVHEDVAGGPVGGIGQTTVEVQELIAATPEAGRALLAFLTSIDLATRVELHERPLDDELELATADPRALRTIQQGDALWLRILDLPAAVAGRSWAADADLVLQVDAPGDPGLDGRWALRIADGAGVAERSERPADLAIAARDLASAYLGGVRVAALAAAGVVVEHEPGAVATLDLALRTARAPWTVDVF